MATLDNGDKNFEQIVNEITTGQIKIPQFQRKFVWDVKSSAKLIDSIIKGFPIGTFIYWRTNEELRSVRNIGNLSLPTQNKGEFVNYVLDGQQRITSFFAAVKGVAIKRDDGKIDDYSKIFIDLECDSDNDIVITDVGERADKTFIRLADLMRTDFAFLASFPNDKQPLLTKYRQILEGYNFRGVNLKNADINVATEVFTRLNVGGKELTLFEIMVAKTYDANRKFDLSEKYEELKKELSAVNYETISSSTVLQVVSMLIAKDVTRKQILKLDKNEFIDYWTSATDSIKMTVDFFRNYGIAVSRLLPYNALIVPFSYYFYKHKVTPSGNMLKMLEDFFWRCSLGFRYSNGVEGKLAQDIDKIDKIISGELPTYEWNTNIDKENLLNIGYFSTGRSLIKAILCLYSMNNPRSFNNNLSVRIDNSWLKVSTSKNYHHFFPKAYMRKNFPHISNNLVNHIFNITIVDDYLNKRQIKAKAPAEYINEFIKSNSEIDISLESHLIFDKDEFGVMSNDFETFIDKRATAVCDQLQLKLISQTTGNEVQTENDNELEEELELSDDI
ncbi:DUF262 domain-containing protein [Chryseobacterium sp.]|uniref:GmrSD restriction endonuclease domain-containing protein n=1 Tax=Chryseobacterium sp. TaxID=1871047 RepID=UPI00289B2B06|nr:DUF262 domain-containing protein [Chryseobacterium sp.]